LQVKEFKDKVALITGAGNGFGQEFAKEACRRGMKLMLADIDEADVKRTAGMGA
jgi:NADP-dependent 3-hydroxy acid dehydrogenase YdfG